MFQCQWYTMVQIFMKNMVLIVQEVPQRGFSKKKTSKKHGWGGEFCRSSFTFRLGGLGSKSNGKLLIEFPFCKQYLKGTESP